MEPNDDDRVVIRLRDVYDIARSVEGKVDLLTIGMANVETIARDHEQRLRTVERRVFSLPSLAVLLAIGSLVVGIVALSRDNTAPATPSGGLSAPKVAKVSPSTSSSPSSAPASSVVMVRQPSSTSTTAPRSTTTSSAPVTVPPVTVPSPPSSVTQLLDRIGHLVSPVTVSLRP
jgi:hypothetical protein